MNIFMLVGRFWAEYERASLTASATVLYFRLIYEANKSFWRGPLALSWSYLQGVLGLSRGTLSSAISDLKSRGLITYEKSGKRSAFWFPESYWFDEWFKNRTDNRTNLVDWFDNRTDNRTNDRTNDRTNNRTIYIKDNKTIRQKDSNNNIHDFSSSSEEEKSCQNSDSNFDDHAFTPFRESQPSLYASLPRKARDIIDTWELLVRTSFKESWLADLKDSLKLVTPQQIKQAIQIFLLKRPGKLEEIGFPYLASVIRQGAFGFKKTKPKDKTPYDELLKLYNEICKDLPRVNSLSPQLRKLFKQRWKEHPDMELWKRFFERVQASDFLTNRTGRTKVKITLSWLLEPSHFNKINEGKYDNFEDKALFEELDRIFEKRSDVEW